MVDPIHDDRFKKLLSRAWVDDMENIILDYGFMDINWGEQNIWMQMIAALIYYMGVIGEGDPIGAYQIGFQREFSYDDPDLVAVCIAAQELWGRLGGLK